MNKNIGYCKVEKATDLAAIYDILKDLENEYPSFKHWYDTKVVPEIANGSREIWACRVANKFVAVMILKRTAYEKKVCTLRVSKEYQRMGIGTQLLKIAQKQLKTIKPVITVSKKREKEFERLFEKFGYIRYAEYTGYYSSNETEISYNGSIEPRCIRCEDIA